MIHIQIGHGSVIIEADEVGLHDIEDSVERAETDGSCAFTSSLDDPNGVSAVIVKRKEGS